MNSVSVGKDLPADGDPVYPGAVITSQILQDQAPVFPAALDLFHPHPETSSAERSVVGGSHQVRRQGLEAGVISNGMGVGIIRIGKNPDPGGHRFFSPSP